MEHLNFLVDTSLGEIDVWLYDHGLAELEFRSKSPQFPSVESPCRHAVELAGLFQTMGLPAEEAHELATELWSELDESERTERLNSRGWDETRKEWRVRTGRKAWWQRSFT